MSTRAAADVRYTWAPGDDTAPPELGGKARSLHALVDAGFTVPDWFAVTPEALRDSLSMEQQEAWSEGRRSDVDRADMRLSPAVQEALADAIGRTFEEDEDLLFAVRASALGQEAVGQSGAESLDRFFFVPSLEVADRVADVWRSAFRPSVFEDRRAQGRDGSPSLPAIVVQRMINPDRAGVAFSADPSTGRRGICVIGAVRGVGTALVDGTEDGDTFCINRGGQVVERTIRRQHVAHRWHREGRSGLREATLMEEDGSAPALTDEQATAMAEQARRVERHFGRPQNVEWAWKGDTLFLLQARPIPKLAGRPDPDAPLRVWDNSNIAENYSGVTTPLTFTVAHRAYEAASQRFLRAVQVPESVLEAHADTFRSMIGLIRGRVYYNLLSWYRALAQLPGFRFNRAFMEDMMGVEKRLPAELLPEREAASVGERVWNALRIVWSGLHLAWYHVRMGDRIDDFHDLLDRTLTSSPALEHMRLDELADAYRTLEEKLLDRWDVPIANNVFAMVFFGLSKRAVERWGGAAADQYNHLLTGHGARASTEPARRMHDMAEHVTGRPRLTTTLLHGSLHEIEAALDNRPELRAKYEAYLDRFGDRGLNELKLESPTLRDNPRSLWRSIGAMARRAQEDDAASGPDEQRMRKKAEDALDEALSGKPVRYWGTRWALRHARDRIAAREDLRFERTRVFGEVRRIFLEMGRRLVANDRLDAPRDVFYLERGELLGVVEGTASSTHLRALVDARRNEFEQYHAAPPPPDRVRTRGAVHVFDLIPETNGADEAEGRASADDGWVGTGCCSGTVRGPVRVVRDPRDATLEPGEILVTERAGPGWITLFAGASGLLVERGSLLSHAAIVSREIGIPSVVSLPGIVDHLETGDEVELDGQTGRVRRVDNAGEQP